MGDEAGSFGQSAGGDGRTDLTDGIIALSGELLQLLLELLDVSLILRLLGEKLVGRLLLLLHEFANRLFRGVGRFVGHIKAPTSCG